MLEVIQVCLIFVSVASAYFAGRYAEKQRWKEKEEGWVVFVRNYVSLLNKCYDEGSPVRTVELHYNGIQIIQGIEGA